MIQGIIDNTKYKKYELDASECYVDTGDLVFPDMIIGIEYFTGREVIAYCTGRVATAYFNPAHRSIIVMIMKL